MYNNTRILTWDNFQSKNYKIKYSKVVLSSGIKSNTHAFFQREVDALRKEIKNLKKKAEESTEKYVVLLSLYIDRNICIIEARAVVLEVQLHAFL